jgi:hypothetical protein
MVEVGVWKTLGATVERAWSGIGPLAGVLVGAWLARSWDRKKWISDGRKEECRELLTAMTVVADLALEAYSKKGTPEFTHAMKIAWEEERKCLRILQDRIFIAGRLKDTRVRKLWQTVTTDYLRDGDAKVFGKRLDEIKTIIIDIALNA